ncbi:MAG: prolipoprotein diacylglyceryl transferase [Burkholderiales bacterium]
MLIHPQIDPIAIALGPLAIRWYGLMYLIAFGLFFFLGRYRARKDSWRGASDVLIDDLLFWGVMGVVLGGRLGYVLFYKPVYYLGNPLEALAIWHGGMSFHGGLLGVIVAMWWMGRKHRLGFLAVADFVAPLIPCGLAAGRMGNFINGELWGRVVSSASDVPWAMVFRGGGPLPRHPSQLYQFALEGLLLFVLLWMYSAKARPRGAVAAMFLIGYGVLRFIAEVFREPDDFLGLLALNMSMGQWLSLPMVLLGAIMLTWSYRRPASP